MSTISSVAAMGRALWPPTGPYYAVKLSFSYPGQPANVVQLATPATGGSVQCTIARYNDQGTLVADGSATITSAVHNFNTSLPQATRDETARYFALEDVAGQLITQLNAAGATIPTD
jgi:hypothetical protein